MALIRFINIFRSQVLSGLGMRTYALGFIPEDQKHAPSEDGVDQNLLAMDFICQKMEMPNLAEVLELFATKIL